MVNTLFGNALGENEKYVSLFTLFIYLFFYLKKNYTCVPHPEPSSLLPPHTIPLGRPSAPAPSIQHHQRNSLTNPIITK